MGKGKRYSGERKLNIKKVLALLIIIGMIVLFVFGINNLLKNKDSKINYFSDISYFVAYENGKWGVINSKGEIVINPQYEEIITIPNKNKDIFICTYDVNYSDGSYKTKAINVKNEPIFTEYTNIEPLSNYESVNNVWNEDNVLKIEKDGKYGLINLEGNQILSCIYDEINTLKGVKNSIVTIKDGKYGLVNNRGELIIDNEFTDINPLTNDYANGYIVKNSDSKYGIISTSGDKILDCKFDEIKHICGNNLYIVKVDGKWQITNKSEDKNIPLDTDDVKYINSEVFISGNNGKYGIYGLDKTEKVKPEYDEIEYAFSDYYIAKNNNKYGIINASGDVLVNFEYDGLSYNKDADCLYGKKNDEEDVYLINRALELKHKAKNVTICNGFIRANINGEYKFFNLKFEEKTNRDAYANNTLFVAKNDGKYGLVNRDGTLVVQYQYDDITEQNEYGYVAVKKDGRWGVIDKDGNSIVAPKYEFTDISQVKFIGKWHSAEDVNTSYFIF